MQHKQEFRQLQLEDFSSQKNPSSGQKCGSVLPPMCLCFVFHVELSALAYIALSLRKALNKSRLQARQEAAGHSTLSATRRVTPEALGLSVDESVAYIHPETDKVIKFSVIGFGMSKSKGRWFTVTYPGDPDVEVELTEEEVKDMLITRIYIDELEDE